MLEFKNPIRVIERLLLAGKRHRGDLGQGFHLIYYTEEWIMHRFAQDNAEVDLEELRDRLRRMSDERLLQFGEAARFMCSKRANGNQPPSKTFLVQLGETRAEWRRRKIHADTGAN